MRTMFFPPLYEVWGSPKRGGGGGGGPGGGGGGILTPSPGSAPDQLLVFSSIIIRNKVGITDLIMYSARKSVITHPEGCGDP